MKFFHSEHWPTDLRLCTCRWVRKRWSDDPIPANRPELSMLSTCRQLLAEMIMKCLKACHFLVEHCPTHHSKVQTEDNYTTLECRWSTMECMQSTQMPATDSHCWYSMHSSVSLTNVVASEVFLVYPKASQTAFDPTCSWCPQMIAKGPPCLPSSIDFRLNLIGNLIETIRHKFQWRIKLTKHIALRVLFQIHKRNVKSLKCYEVAQCKKDKGPWLCKQTHVQHLFDYGSFFFFLAFFFLTF